MEKFLFDNLTNLRFAFESIKYETPSLFRNTKFVDFCVSMYILKFKKDTIEKLKMKKEDVDYLDVEAQKMIKDERMNSELYCSDELDEDFF